MDSTGTNSTMSNQPTTGQTTGGGDMLDKGVDFLEKQTGHEQVYFDLTWIKLLLII